MLPYGTKVAVLRNPQLGYLDEVLLPGGEFVFDVVYPIEGVTKLAFLDCKLPTCGRRYTYTIQLK